MWLVCLIGLQRVVWDWLHLLILIISKFQLTKNLYLLCIYLPMSDLRSCRQKISFWLKSQKHCLFFIFCWRSDLLHPYSTSFTGTRVNCCLTCAVTLPHAICIPLSQIHYYTIPLVGKGFAMCQPRPQTRKGKSINLVLGQRRKKKGLHQCLLIC